MQIVARRTLRGTLAALVNLALAWATAFVVIGNQTIREEVSIPWIIVGILLIAWGGVILFGLFRPVKLRIDDKGVWVIRLFGHHFFEWDELNYIDFDRNSRMAILVATVEGRDLYGAVSKRSVDPEVLERIHRAIRAKRPDLPVIAPLASQQDASA